MRPTRSSRSTGAWVLAWAWWCAKCGNVPLVICKSGQEHRGTKYQTAYNCCLQLLQDAAPYNSLVPKCASQIRRKKNRYFHCWLHALRCGDRVDAATRSGATSFGSSSWPDGQGAEVAELRAALDLPLSQRWPAQLLKSSLLPLSTRRSASRGREGRSGVPPCRLAHLDLASSCQHLIQDLLRCKSLPLS